MKTGTSCAVLLVIACLISFVDAGAQEPCGLKQLTDDPAQDGFPSWSPDGSRIAFKEGSNLWVLDVSSGRFDKVFSEPGKVPIPTGWSPDGTEIADPRDAFMQT
jgi:Tol biopolymer transport system component